MDAHRRIPEAIQPLRIRLRQVFSGDGEAAVAKSVFCPARGCSVSLETCCLCGHCQGTYEGPGEPAAFCDHLKSQDLAALKPEPSVLQANKADQTPVSLLMTTDVLCVREDVSVEALIALLLERNISGVPVVDRRGAPIGIISKTDLVRHRYEDDTTQALDRTLGPGFHIGTLTKATVAELMTPVPIAITEDTPIAEVAAAMAQERVHRLPVVATDGTVVGIVSSLDLVRWYAQREGYEPDSTHRKAHR